MGSLKTVKKFLDIVTMIPGVKVDFRVLTNHKCITCDKPLKHNLVNKKTYNCHTRTRMSGIRIKCYKCFKSKGNVNTSSDWTKYPNKGDK